MYMKDKDIADAIESFAGDVRGISSRVYVSAQDLPFRQELLDLAGEMDEFVRLLREDL